MSPALKHVKHVWDSVPSRSSDQRRGHAMHAALRNAICAGMKFEKGDFRHMADKLGLSTWIGDGGMGWIYGLACGKDRASENLGAAQSIEHFWGIDPFLWAEQTRTPKRLYEGCRFTWKGQLVTVTSFDVKAKSLTACVHSKENWRNHTDMKVGGIMYFRQEYREIQAAVENKDGSIVVRFSGPVEDVSSKIVRRFTITSVELMAAMKDYDSRRRQHEKAIAAATTLAELEVARKAAADEGQNAYRHFDIEILTEKVASRCKEIERAMSEAEYERYRAEENKRLSQNLERWVAGEDVREYLSGLRVRVRVKGDYVETSNGHKVSIDAARKTLKFVNRHRDGWHRNGQSFDVDAFQLQRISSDGVQIGCTLIPWPEVERCKTLLNEACGPVA